MSKKKKNKRRKKSLIEAFNDCDKHNKEVNDKMGPWDMVSSPEFEKELKERKEKKERIKKINKKILTTLLCIAYTGLIFSIGYIMYEYLKV